MCSSDLSEVPDLRTGSEVVLGGLMALAVAGAGRMVPTGIVAVITLVAGLALLRAVVAWEFHLRQIPGGATHRDRVAALAVSTVILFAASIGVAALVPGIITIPGTPSARPDAVGPYAILAVGIGSAIAAMLLAGRMASLRRESQAAIIRCSTLSVSPRTTATSFAAARSASASSSVLAVVQRTTCVGADARCRR